MLIIFISFLFIAFFFGIIPRLFKVETVEKTEEKRVPRKPIATYDEGGICTIDLGGC